MVLSTIFQLYRGCQFIGGVKLEDTEKNSVTSLLVTGVLKRMSAIAKGIADQSVYEDLMEHSRYLRYLRYINDKNVDIQFSVHDTFPE
jgi:hypothetical protein